MEEIVKYGGVWYMWEGWRGVVVVGDKLWWWEYKESVMNYILQEFRDLVLCGLFQKVPPWLERSEKELFLDFGWNLHGELGSCWTGKAEVTTWGEFRSIQEYSTDPPILHYGCHLKLFSSQYFISDKIRLFSVYCLLLSISRFCCWALDDSIDFLLSAAVSKCCVCLLASTLWNGSHPSSHTQLR